MLDRTSSKHPQSRSVNASYQVFAQNLRSLLEREERNAYCFDLPVEILSRYEGVVKMGTRRLLPKSTCVSHLVIPLANGWLYAELTIYIRVSVSPAGMTQASPILSKGHSLQHTRR